MFFVLNILHLLTLYILQFTPFRACDPRAYGSEIPACKNFVLLTVVFYIAQYQHPTHVKIIEYVCHLRKDSRYHTFIIKMSIVNTGWCILCVS